MAAYNPIKSQAGQVAGIQTRAGLGDPETGGLDSKQAKEMSEAVAEGTAIAQGQAYEHEKAIEKQEADIIRAEEAQAASDKRARRQRILRGVARLGLTAIGGIAGATLGAAAGGVGAIPGMFAGASLGASLVGGGAPADASNAMYLAELQQQQKALKEQELFSGGPSQADLDATGLTPIELEQMQAAYGLPPLQLTPGQQQQQALWGTFDYPGKTQPGTIGTY